MSSNNAECIYCGVKHIPGSNAERICKEQLQGGVAGNSITDDDIFPSEFNEFDDDFDDFDDFDEDFEEEEEEPYSDILQEYDRDENIQELLDEHNVPEEIVYDMADKGFGMTVGMEEYDAEVTRQIVEEYNKHKDDPEFNIHDFNDSHLMNMSGKNIIENFEEMDSDTFTDDPHVEAEQHTKEAFENFDGEEAAQVYQSISMYASSYYTAANEYLRAGATRDFQHLQDDMQGAQRDIERFANDSLGRLMEQEEENGSDIKDAESLLKDKFTFHDNGMIKSFPNGMESDEAIDYMGKYRTSDVLKSKNSTVGLRYNSETERIEFDNGGVTKQGEDSRDTANRMVGNIKKFIDASESNNSGKKNVLFRGVSIPAARNFKQFEVGSQISMDGFSSFTTQPQTANSFADNDGDEGVNDKPGVIVATTSSGAAIGDSDLHNNSPVFDKSDGHIPEIAKFNEGEMLLNHGKKFELLNKFETEEKVFFFVKDA